MGKTEVRKNNERRLMPRNPFTNFREMEKEDVCSVGISRTALTRIASDHLPFIVKLYPL